MAEDTILALLWLANAVVALIGVVYYILIWWPSWKLCSNPEARLDMGVRRVCQRRIFRYTSRAGLKMLLAFYCVLRAQIVMERTDPPISIEQWASAIVILAVLLWLTVDTVISRRYD